MIERSFAAIQRVELGIKPLEALCGMPRGQTEPRRNEHAAARFLDRKFLVGVRPRKITEEKRIYPVAQDDLFCSCSEHRPRERLRMVNDSCVHALSVEMLPQPTTRRAAAANARASLTRSDN